MTRRHVRQTTVGAVFSDPTGRRRRLMRRGVYVIGGGCVIYMGLLGTSLTGSISPDVLVPPGIPDKIERLFDPESAQVQRDEPSPAAAETPTGPWATSDYRSPPPGGPTSPGSGGAGSGGTAGPPDPGGSTPPTVPPGATPSAPAVPEPPAPAPPASEPPAPAPQPPELPPAPEPSVSSPPLPEAPLPDTTLPQPPELPGGSSLPSLPG